MGLRWSYRLPPLGRAAFGAYAAFVALALALTLFTQFHSLRMERDYIRLSEALHSLGLSYATDFNDTQAICVAPIEAPDPPLAQGPAHLVAIDGAPPGTLSRPDYALLEGPLGATHRITLRDAAGALRTFVVSRRAGLADRSFAGSGLTFRSSEWIQFWIQSGGILAGTGFLVLLFLLRPRDPVAAMIVTGIFCIWVQTFAYAWPAAPSWWMPLCFVLAVLFINTGLVAFPDGYFGGRLARLSLFATVLYLAFYVYAHERPRLAALNSWLFAATFLPVMATLVQRGRSAPPGIVHQQLKLIVFIFVASIASYCCAALARAGMQARLDMGYQAWFSIIAVFGDCAGSMLIAMGALSALQRYRLYDTEVLISRSAALALLTLLLGAAFAGSEKIVEVLGEEFFGHQNKAIAAGLGAAIAAMAISPLHGRLHHWTEQRFRKGLDALRALPAALRELRDYASAADIAGVAGQAVANGLRASQVAIVLEDAARFVPAYAQGVDAAQAAERSSGLRASAAPVECVQDDPVFPLRLRLALEGGRGVGWLLLGPRPDGSLYGKGERDALRALAAPIATALHVARRRDLRDAAIAGLERRLALLQEQALAREESRGEADGRER